MKILMVVGSYYPDAFGGTEIFTKNLSEKLIKKQLEVCVICAGESNCVEIINGVKVYRIKMLRKEPINKKNKIYNKKLDIYNRNLKKQYYDILKAEKPDILHVQMFRTITPSIDEVAKELNIKIVHTLHEPYSAWNFNAFDFDSYDKLLDTKPNLRTKIYQRKIKKIVNKIDYCVAPSNVAINYYKNLGFFKNKKIKFKVIRNAIEFDINQVQNIINKKLNKERNGKINFLYLGRLFYYKGIETLIDVFKTIKNNNITLTIAGNGPLQNYVIENIKDDERIKYIGFITGGQKEKVLFESDVQICPSEFLETFGLVVLEGYKSGNVMISSNIGDLKNNVIHKKTGYVFESKNKIELKNAINYFTDEKNINYCLQNLLLKLQEYNEEKMINEYIDVYKEMLND